MIELRPDQFSNVIPLFQRTDYGVLAMSTLAGHHPGRVFVDDAHHPRAGLVCTRAGIGYYFLAGIPGDQAFTWLDEAFTKDFVPAQVAATGSPEVLLFFYPQTAWKTPLFEQFHDRKPVEIFKHRFTLPAEAARRVRGWQSGLPEGMRVIPYKKTLMEAHPEIKEEVCLFYGSVETFLEHSLGVYVLDGETVACTCLAVFTGCGEAEISIATAEAYRRRGLAQIAAAAFIEAALARGLNPIWGCWPNNTPSVGLAQKLGFVEAAQQPVCLWVESEEWKRRD